MEIKLKLLMSTGKIYQIILKKKVNDIQSLDLYSIKDYMSIMEPQEIFPNL